jgi:WD40 repeat protein
VMTGSQDGILKFWKKQHIGIDFVTKFKCYTGPILLMKVSGCGNYLATFGIDDETTKGLIRLYDMRALD